MRLLVFRGAAALAALFLILSFAACGGNNNTVDTTVAKIVLQPTSVSLNEGQVASLSFVAQNSAGATVAADITFTSSNPAIATVSTGGLICAGVWDSAFINCNFTNGQAGVGQVTITATANGTSVSANTTVYVHEQVDQVVTLLNSDCPNGQPSACTTMGQPVTICGKAYSITAPGCSPSAPCDISSTVGPFSFGSGNVTVASTSSGIDPTYNPDTNTPVYLSGGTVMGSKGQTCNLTNFNSVADATATVTLTGDNAIAMGTQLTITNSGHGASVPATSATLSNGSATCSGTASVQTAITSGVFTAESPGTTTVFASVSGVNSVGVNYLTCAVKSIFVHDPNNGSNTSFTINPQATQGLVADVLDTNGNAIAPTLVWGSFLPAVAPVATSTAANNSATVTGIAGGTTYITATCSNPDCNIGLSPQYSENVATFNVTTPAPTTVYAASTASKMLVPISTSTNTAGTPITLPDFPNSIVSDPFGRGLYLGSASGLIAVTTAGIVSQIAASGTAVAISSNGQYLLVSDNTNNQLRYVSLTASNVTGIFSGSTASSAFTPDGRFNEWVNGTTLGFEAQTGLSGSVTLPNPGNTLDIAAQGGLTYVTSAMAGQIYEYSTCDVSLQQTLTAGNPTLIKALPNGTGALAADSPNIDLLSSPAVLMPGCPDVDQSQIHQYDLGAGAFNAQQLLVSPDATHAYLITDQPKVLSFDVTTQTPGSVTLANNATAYNGGITADGSRVYLGTTDGTVHIIVTADMFDAAQVPVNLTDANGAATTPNLVTVLP